MADVFISYKRERRPAARHLEQILTRYGYSVWYDLELVRGNDYESQIQRELNAAKAVVVLWCGLSVESPGVRSEASRAKFQGKLIPVKIEACELPLFSTLEQHIDLTAASCSPRDHALDPLLDDLERLVGRPPAPDFKLLREYEATWRSLGGGLPFARLPREQTAVSDEAFSGVPEPTPPKPGTGPAHDYAFWERQWERHGGTDNIVALRAITEDAPRYFADQARARIADIQAAAAAAREAEARQRAELERSSREREALEQRFRAEGRIKVEALQIHGAPSDQNGGGWLKPGSGKTEWFKDHDLGPEMVVVPAKEPFAIGRFVLTFDEWDRAQAHSEWQKFSGIAPRRASDHGWGRGRQPAIDVSWEDAKAYCA